jgi:hypothetical protein
MNDEAARSRPDVIPDLSQTSYRLGRHASTNRYSLVRTLTPLQEWLVTASLVIEDAREELDVEAWRAFVWILCDRIGEEAPRIVVAEALEATEDAA